VSGSSWVDQAHTGRQEFDSRYGKIFYSWLEFQTDCDIHLAYLVIIGAICLGMQTGYLRLVPRLIMRGFIPLLLSLSSLWDN